MTLHEMLVDEIKDQYHAEKQLTKALPKMARAANHEDLREAFETHLEETHEQLARLEEVFDALGEKVKAKPCAGMTGIIEEGKDTMEEDAEGAVMDAALIAAAQRAEHYEIGAYGHLRRVGSPARARRGRLAARDDPRGGKSRRSQAHRARRVRDQSGGGRSGGRGRRRGRRARIHPSTGPRWQAQEFRPSSELNGSTARQSG